MDLSAVLASRKRMAEASTVSSEGLGTRAPAAVSTAASAEASRSALLAFGGQPPRAECGFAGLLNQGATCYLNSLVQVMFSISDLRKALYEWNYVESEPGEAAMLVTRQLQELFAELQLTARAAVPTTRLTRSFGWAGEESFVQNDVHECMSVLFDALQTQTIVMGSDGERVASFVRNMSTGKMENYTTCLGCQRTSVRPDEYKSLMVPVRGCADLDASFSSFLGVEKLEGANQYFCEACGGKQDALRGMRLPADGLPATLFVSLNRFEFDYASMTRRKVNDKLTPALALDMGKYVHRDATPPPTAGKGTGATGKKAEGEAEELNYDLVAVLMHMGAATAGHYFAYIRTGNGWLHFNDSTVTRIEEHNLARALGQHKPAPVAAPAEGAAAAAAAAAGDGSGAAAVPAAAAAPAAAASGGAGTGTTASASSTSGPAASTVHDASTGAYMLVYRRRDTVADFLQQPDAIIPPALRARIEAENAKYLAARKEYEAEQRKVRLRVFFDPVDVVIGDGPVPAAAAAAVAASAGGPAPSVALADKPVKATLPPPVVVGVRDAATTTHASITGAAMLSSVVPDEKPLDAVDIVVPDESPVDTLLAATLSAVAVKYRYKTAAGAVSQPTTPASAGGKATAATPTSGSGTGADGAFKPSDAAGGGSLSARSDASSSSTSSASASASAPVTAASFSHPYDAALFRLRHYNTLKGITLAPVEETSTTTTTGSTTAGDAAAGSGTDASGPLVKHTGLVTGKAVVLEHRASADAPWEPFLPGCLPLKVVLFHPAAGTYNVPVVVNVPPGPMTVGALREAAARQFAAEAHACGFTAAPGDTPRVRLILLKTDSEDAAVVLGDDSVPLTGGAPATTTGEGGKPLAAAAAAAAQSTTAPAAAAAAAGAAIAAAAAAAAPAAAAPAAAAGPRLSAGDIVHVELCPLEGPGSDVASATGSAVISSWDANVNTVTITFNIPTGMTLEALPPASREGVTKNGITGGHNGTVRVDQRLTLGDLKVAVASFLGVPVDGFRVKRSAGSIEFKDTTATLFYYSLVGGGSVYIELGRPLAPDEYEFKITMQLPPDPAAVAAAAAAPAAATPAAGGPAAAAAAAASALRRGGPGGPGGIGPRPTGPGAAAPASVTGPSPRYISLGPLPLKGSVTGSDIKRAIVEAFAKPTFGALLPADCQPGGVNHDLFVAAAGGAAAAAAAAAPSDTAGAAAAPFVPFPAATNIRLRERTPAASKLGRVIVDDKTLAWSYSNRLADGKEMVVQVTRHAEVSRDGDMLLTCVRWNPLTNGIAVSDEAVFASSMPLTEFAATLVHRATSAPAAAPAAASGAGTSTAAAGIDLVPGMTVKMTKPLPWHLSDPLVLWQLRWSSYELSSEAVDAALGVKPAAAPAAGDAPAAAAPADDASAPATADAAAPAAADASAGSAAPAPAAASAAAAPTVETLGKCGWTLKAGDMVLWCLQDEFESPAAIGKPSGSGAAGASGSSGVPLGAGRRYGGDGDGFKIYTPEEQRQREAARKEKEEKDKKEAEERTAALQAALAARMAAGGAAAAAAATDSGAAAAGDTPKPPPLPTHVRDADDMPVPAALSGMDKYFRFLQLGMEPAAVRAKMVADGADPSLLEGL